jgi:mycothiol synthase
MAGEFVLRNYRPGDLEALVALINESDEYDQLERATTVEHMKHEMSWPNYQPETDCFLVWKNGRLVGFADFFFRRGTDGGDSVFYASGVVHPRWRRLGLGRRLMEALYQRAAECMAEVTEGPVYFQASTRDIEEDRKALFKNLGMVPVRYFVDMVRPINNGLPPVKVPAGFRLRPFDPARDLKTVWRVDVESFQDHWGFTDFPFEEYLHWVQQPHFRPELWLLAEEQASGRVVGIGLNKIDPDRIAKTGRQEGYVSTLAVLREYRKQGLGTALLARSLYELRQAGMESAHLGADAENLTGAMRIYEHLGFQVRKTSIAYRRTLRGPSQETF